MIGRDEPVEKCEVLRQSEAARSGLAAGFNCFGIITWQPCSVRRAFSSTVSSHDPIIYSHFLSRFYFPARGPCISINLYLSSYIHALALIRPRTHSTPPSNPTTHQQQTRCASQQSFPSSQPSLFARRKSLSRTLPTLGMRESSHTSPVKDPLMQLLRHWLRRPSLNLTQGTGKRS